jgi:hypothetical protein
MREGGRCIEPAPAVLAVGLDSALPRVVFVGRRARHRRGGFSCAVIAVTPPIDLLGRQGSTRPSTWLGQRGRH